MIRDTDIIDHYWQRDQRAISESDEKYGAYCSAIAVNIVGNERDGEECVSDTWLAAWNTMPPKRPARLSAYFAAICPSRALNIARREGQAKRGGGELARATEALNALSRRVCQIFTVDDLMHLRRGGRLSNISAVVGTVLQIKPLLLGNEEGKILSIAKIRGRKHSVEALAEKYDALVEAPETQTVGIAHAGCREDADYLVSLLKRNKPPKDILVVDYEPMTGAHVGPGALALFFVGRDDVRSTR